MRFSIPPLSLAAAFVLALPVCAARKKEHVPSAPAAPIACSRGSCGPVPAGCHPEPGFLPDGMPSGYDVIVCPDYR